MARISTYTKDTHLSGEDKVIGTDSDNLNATVNFTLTRIAEFVEDLVFNSTYTFIQSSASSVWTIQHDLERHPSVTVVDSSGNVVVGYINYNNINQITLTFTAPFSGKAYLN